MVRRPSHFNAFEFVTLAALRAQQLMAGCVPRVEGEHKATTIAQMEVSEYLVTRADFVPPVTP
jgi:DNA-directed RNA polymerase subunit K/omega